MSMNISMKVLNNEEFGTVEEIGKFKIHNNKILWATINTNVSKSRLYKAEQRINRLISIKKDRINEIKD